MILTIERSFEASVEWGGYSACSWLGSSLAAWVLEDSWIEALPQPGSAFVILIPIRFGVWCFGLSRYGVTSFYGGDDARRRLSALATG
ncbi:hypothetical protein M0R45_000732 [Rubus argutus]|uniref:Uncharacterized protein n=1 Tax=Rubus argutus TaxID=59490 RepID=A0AAW1VP69_RUBAR